MTTVRHAVIDVGTNSVKLLVGEVGNADVQPLLEQSEQTRLGRGFYETHVLLSEAIARTAEAVGKFANLAREQHAASIRVIATSAARDAVNRATLLEAIEKASNLKVEIISGEDEAELVFRGVATAPELHGRRLLILDVGGGSTEFIMGEGKHHRFRKSFDLGTVRLIEKLRPADPAGVDELKNCRNRLHDLFTGEIGPAVLPALGDPAKLTLVGTGGTTTILARIEKGLGGFDRHDIEGTIVPRERVVYWLERLWTLSVAERCQIVGIPGNRADIVTMGLAIYEGVMDYFRLPELFVSTRGLRFGALLQADD